MRLFSFRRFVFAATAISERAVAMLVFLARAARAGRVSRGFAPGTGIVRIGSDAGIVPHRALDRRRVAIRNLFLARCRVGVMRMHLRQRFVFDSGRLFFRHELRNGKLARHVLAKPGEQAFEEFEGFGLVFVQRIALGIASQPHGLAQMIVAEAEALAKTNGFSMINLDVRSTQDRAIQSFEARGFVRYAVNDHYARVGNDYVSGYYYQKELS